MLAFTLALEAHKSHLNFLINIKFSDNYVNYLQQFGCGMKFVCGGVL